VNSSGADGMIPVGSILTPVQFDWLKHQGKLGVTRLLIGNLEFSKKILSEFAQCAILK